MDHVEEQRNELEALQSIYFTEFAWVAPGQEDGADEDASDVDEDAADDDTEATQDDSTHNVDSTSTPFTIALAADEEIPDAIRADHCQLKLRVQFTEKYPEELPLFSLRQVVGLDAEERAQWMADLVQIANDSLGMAMIFTLACHLKERLDATVNERVNTRKEAAEQRRKAEEDIENRKFQGSRVSKETFLAWKQAFDREMYEVNAEQRRREEEKRKKPSGRQLFEADRTLIASDAKFAEEGVDVDVTLFEAMDLNDLDEQDEDDDDAVAAILRAATED